MTDQEQVTALQNDLELARESLVDLQLQLEDRGWASLTGADNELNLEFVRKAAQQCRVLSIYNPLIKRALAVRASYVWGQGVGVTARDDAVDAVVQAFLDDEENRQILTGHQAHVDMETTLGTDGNWFIALFTKPLTGRVRPRVMRFDQLEKITDPDDQQKVLFYKRTYARQTFDWATGNTGSAGMVTEYHPDLRYRPVTRPKTIGGDIVRWDAPILHVFDNGPAGALYGIGDAFAAVPWAVAYKTFLEDWARLVKALSKVAWKLTSPTKSASQKARREVENMQFNGEAGGAVSLANMTLEAVPKTGATIDSESGRPLAIMVAAAVGLPVTTLTGDPGQTGARATAETLNQPTRLEFQGRRELWTEALRAILGYVVDQAALAPRGPLSGRLVRDEDQLLVDLGTTERTLDFAWPDLEEIPVDVFMNALAKASDAGLDALPKERLRLMLRALKVRDVDELLDQVTDENGNFIDPAMSAGQAAADRFRKGQTDER